MILLINRVSGRTFPLFIVTIYRPAMILESILSEYAKDKDGVLFKEEVPRTSRKYRYKERGLLVGLGVGNRTISKRPVDGIPGASKLIIRGSKLNPLDYFVVRTFIDRISYGDILLLR